MFGGWWPDWATLMHVLTHAIAIFLVAAGTGMLVLSFQSEVAAAYAAIFFGMAGALAWAAKKPPT